MSDILDAEIVDEQLETTTVKAVLSDEHIAFVKALREFADFYEARPTLKLPGKARFDIWGLTAQDMPAVARLFGKLQKRTLGDTLFMLNREFGELIELEANWQRDAVCERVVVGTETVEEPVMERVGTKTITKEKVEWHCPKVLQPKLPEGV